MYIKVHTVVRYNILGLFDAEFDIVIPQHDIKNLTNKIIASQQNNDDIKNTEKVLKSKNISLLDRLSIISSRVLNILGKQKKNNREFDLL